MYFSSKIKEERLKHNMSQQQLGEKLNISRQSISKWERGESYPSIELLIKISDIFDITLDELVKGDNSLKEKIIKDSQVLAYPRWKLFFDILLIIGLFIVLGKLCILIGNKLFDLNIVFFRNSLLFNIVPFFMSIIGAIGSETLAKKYK
ncbi:MAG: helix-turn-helix transcriptional regulator [Niallia nealsonii]|uniref:Helix-turn-helix transcriptional regulator n=1 Tax=Niallia circulans TaxID=1397 RepID=A0A941GK46_NIACI|nr:helix-turn-helix transcriptional regulator [Niallia circulans]MCB5236554.1 helix-turn-helix domain-containing protein [Niallia circulans]MDU1845521.1 helix-turn-helix transcriptional regulator [Niallia nealsonii]